MKHAESSKGTKTKMVQGIDELAILFSIRMATRLGAHYITKSMKVQFNKDQENAWWDTSTTIQSLKQPYFRRVN